MSLAIADSVMDRKQYWRMVDNDLQLVQFDSIFASPLKEEESVTARLIHYTKLNPDRLYWRYSDVPSFRLNASRHYFEIKL